MESGDLAPSWCWVQSLVTGLGAGTEISSGEIPENCTLYLPLAVLLHDPSTQNLCNLECIGRTVVASRLVEEPPLLCLLSVSLSLSVSCLSVCLSVFEPGMNNLSVLDIASCRRLRLLVHIAYRNARRGFSSHSSPYSRSPRPPHSSGMDLRSFSCVSLYSCELLFNRLKHEKIKFIAVMRNFCHHILL